jgi:glycosyltransferase involved in cell wall biosynthesis
MRIWHITKVLHGGSGQYALRSHQALLARGVDSNLLLLQGGDPPRIYQLQKTGGVVDRAVTKLVRGISHRVATAPFHSLLGREGYRTPVPIGRKDIVHLHGLTGWMGLAGLRDLLPPGAPIFWTLHDLWPVSGGCVVYRGCHNFTEGCGRCPVLRTGLKPWARLELHLKERLVRSRTIRPLANSRWTAGRIAESRVFRGVSDVPVIPPIVDDVFFAGSTQTLRGELGIAGNAKVLCVGARAVTDKYKGVNVFLRALGDWNRGKQPVEVLLFGEGDLGFIEGLRIHALGRVDDARRMAAIYHTSDLYVSPSLMETFGMSVAEAQACGTAVAGYAVGGVKEAVWEGDVRNFVPVQEIETLLTVVERVLASGLAEKGTAAARAAWVASRFSAKIVGAAQEAVYAAAVESGAMATSVNL